ncbi:hypothetical protein [Stygiolobus caldivivus]|uniref:Uncharacterized protein n=1 Tax=Stygiolobus caldivivus TaxID=2824673 RepID=A0A8D5ZK51_9CREN|nr:hypothetical protein [Stygiolobus caldivivus]BCU70877.1 hypothetical protein KN1_21740 [Stygiolobus caldivivus]
MVRVYKYGDYYFAGVSHVIPGYLQDVVFVYKQGNTWTSISAEKFKSNNGSLIQITERIKYATHEDDISKAVSDLKRMGINIEEVEKPPFPLKILEGKKKIQAEFD